MIVFYNSGSVIKVWTIYAAFWNIIFLFFSTKHTKDSKEAQRLLTFRDPYGKSSSLSSGFGRPQIASGFLKNKNKVF